MNNHENLVNKEEKNLTKNDTTGEYTEDHSSRQNELTKEYSSPGFVSCGDRRMSTTGEFVEILNFRHFARYIQFTKTDPMRGWAGGNALKKEISTSINVSVVMERV